METTFFDKDLKVIYVTAKSFPHGIMAAHEKIHSLLTTAGGRKFFGISRPENENIVYKAAAEELKAGEGKALHCETMSLKKGRYVWVIIKNYEQNIAAIQSAFNTLLELPNLDPNGYCVEWYFNEKDVKCMVRLKN